MSIGELNKIMNNYQTTEKLSYVLMAVFLLFCFFMHLMLVFVSGLTVFILVTHFYKMLAPKMQSDWAGKLTLLVVVLITVLVLSGLVFGIYSAVKLGNENFRNLGQAALSTLQEWRNYLPASLVQYVPNDLVVLKEKITDLAQKSGSHIFEVTGNSLKVMAHMIVGLILGAVVAFSFLKPKQKTHETKPFVQSITNRLTTFAQVFAKVLFAQVKISLINTLLTAIYLLVLLPLCGSHLPYAKTLVLLTFVVGLIPVLGNLVSNTLIVLISVMVSIKIAIASLAFLILVHKLEYYVNAKIVGSKIKTSIWELLIAMVIMETLFGLFGVALAPVIYGYIKQELKDKEVV